MSQMDQQDPVMQVTEELYRKNVEILEERRRAEELLYGVSEAVFAVDKDLKITLLNSTLEEFLGVTKKEVEGKPAMEFIKLKTEKNEPIPIETYCFTPGSGENKIDSVVLEIPNKKDKYVNVKTSIITQWRGDIECLVTMADVTREKELEKTKDDFISITSHELRTPMSIIKSYLWMLSNGKGGSLTVKQTLYVEKASRGTERMLNLINDMLNISRMEQGRVTLKIEEIDLKTFINEVLGEFSIKTAQKGLEFKTTFDNKVNSAFFDKGKLDEILTNLIGNSLKFTENGGIYVNVAPTDEDKVKISIKDTGKGLEKDEIERLFHKFGRLDNSYQTVAEAGGTGLGLYIVKLYVETLGGKVGVVSEGKGKGSTFWFTIPTKYSDERKIELDLTEHVQSDAPSNQSAISSA